MIERLHRMVGGQKIYLTEEEDAAQRAEWAENDAAAARLAEGEALAAKRAAALRAIEDSVLSQAIADPTAPQEVKDYAAVLKS